MMERVWKIPRFLFIAQVHSLILLASTGLIHYNPQKVTRHHFSAWRTLKYTVPKGSTNLSVTATSNDGFYGTTIFHQSVTNQLAQGRQNYLDYRIWGTTLHPKWALKN